jgi:hypothetical protein
VIDSWEDDGPAHGRNLIMMLLAVILYHFAQEKLIGVIASVDLKG